MLEIISIARTTRFFMEIRILNDFFTFEFFFLWEFFLHFVSFIWSMFDLVIFHQFIMNLFLIFNQILNIIQRLLRWILRKILLRILKIFRRNNFVDPIINLIVLFKLQYFFDHSWSILSSFIINFDSSQYQQQEIV